MSRKCLLFALIFTALFVCSLPTLGLNSHALIDNVYIRDANGIITPPGMIDFETQEQRDNLGGFDDSLNTPGVVYIENGAFPGPGGSYLLRMDEDPYYASSLIFRDFLPSSATELVFDFEFNTTSSVDIFVASLLDPNTLQPFPSIPSIYPGFGDFLEASSTGNILAPGAQVTLNTLTLDISSIAGSAFELEFQLYDNDPIPEPSTMLLLGCGFLGLFGYVIRRQKKKS